MTQWILSCCNQPQDHLQSFFIVPTISKVDSYFTCCHECQDNPTYFVQTIFHMENSSWPTQPCIQVPILGLQNGNPSTTFWCQMTITYMMLIIKLEIFIKTSEVHDQKFQQTCWLNYEMETWVYNPKLELFELKVKGVLHSCI